MVPAASPDPSNPKRICIQAAWVPPKMGRDPPQDTLDRTASPPVTRGTPRGIPSPADTCHHDLSPLIYYYSPKSSLVPLWCPP